MPIAGYQPPTAPSTTEPSPIRAFSSSYVTHKSPTTRSGDTFTGKIIGWLEEYLFWLDVEGKCSFIDSLIPEIPIIGEIDNLFISMFQSHYNANYQKVYNNGADKGNDIHNQIFGKFDTVIEDYKNRITQAKTDLTNLINDAKNKISSLVSKINTFESKINSFTSKIGQFDLKINDFSSDLSAFRSKIDGFKSDLSNAFSKLDNFEANLSTLESRLAEADTILNEHASEIKDLIERVKRLEATQQPFQIPKVELNLP